MNHFTLPRRAAWMALIALGILVAMAGCSKRVTSVDTGYTTLEGSPDAKARLLAWRDAPVSLEVWYDNPLGPIGPDDPAGDTKYDSLVGYTSRSWKDPSVIYTVLLEATPATGFQFYRRADGGNLEPLADYAVAPTIKWLSSGWEMYEFDDKHPSAYLPSTYVARGLLDGKVTTRSPLTNDALAGPARPTPSIVLTWAPRWTGTGADSVLVAPPDSVLGFAPVPGAAGYWLDIYQFKNSATDAEKYASGGPNPVLTGNVQHYHLEYGGAAVSSIAFPVSGAGWTAHFLNAAGATIPTDVQTDQIMLKGQPYYVRLTAVDAHGNVLAWMAGGSKAGRVDGRVTGTIGTSKLRQLAGFYEYVPMGAKRIDSGKHSDIDTDLETK
jgi:hypothetical protein